jgi:hypothetical protein
MRLDWSSSRAFCRTDSGLEIVNAKEMEPWSAASLARRIKIVLVLVLVLEKWGWGGAVLQYGPAANCNLRSGLRVLARPW